MNSSKHSFDFDWRGLVGGVIALALVFAIGPIVLISALLLQAWCARSRFDARDRWESIRTFAWLFTALFALAIAAFFALPGPALHVWQASPLAHLLGTPDLLGNLWLRWIGCLPLAFGLALVLEKSNPRTIQWFYRVQTESEQVQLAAARRHAQELDAQQRAEEETRLEAARIEERKRSERAAARKDSARRRAAALAAEGAPAPQTRETTKLEASTPTLWEQATPPTTPPEPPPAPKKPKPDKPDLGDGSMDALL